MKARPARVRTQEGVPRRTAVPFGGLYDDCCQTVTIAKFVRSNLVGMFKRHVGPWCSGILNPIDTASWRRGEIQPATQEGDR